MKIPIEMLKIKDPDGVERIRAVIAFHDAIFHPSTNKKLIEIQNDYAKFVDNCRRQLKKIETNRKNKGDPLLKWTLADTIYRFVKDIELNGYSIANITTALARDLKISTRYVNYLIEFRTTYPDIQSIHKEISWDKYKELFDIHNISLRKNCTDKLLNRELKTREDIRKFKKEVKKYG